MNRLVVLGVIGWIVFAGLGGCQGPDPFDRSIHGSTGGNGNGGFRASGGSGFGGFRASGGSSAGGSGFGGSFGGSGMGGRGMGGVSGASGTGAGGASMGGRGAGGRIVDAGPNCITAIVMAGYTAGAAPPCSACMDQNHNSYETKCTMMIDCMAGKSQPCTGNCELDCFNAVGGNGPLQSCVDALLTAGGCE